MYREQSTTDESGSVQLLPSQLKEDQGKQQANMARATLLQHPLQHMRLSFSPQSASSLCRSTRLFDGPHPAPLFHSCRQHARHARRSVSYKATGIEEPGGPASFSPATVANPTQPLSILPFSNLVRSYLITVASSSPLLLRSSLGALKLLAHSNSPILNPDRNPLLHFLLKRTIYAQFCAGETTAEVDQTINWLKKMGYKGVILGYARESCVDEADTRNSLSQASAEKLNAKEISEWARGTLATVSMAQPGDFVALKFTGAGAQALRDLAQGNPPAPPLAEAITEICELAEARGVRLAFDAEHDVVQAGIDCWTMEYMRRYNRKGKALVYNTYQAYKKAVPRILAGHMEEARKEKFVLGIKLVRGAYLGSDPRHLFWESIDDTHRAYDGIAESLMRRAYNQTLTPVSPSATAHPTVNLVLAGHNSESVRRAQKIRNSQATAGEQRIDLVYGQLMGMAENISCGLVHAGRLAEKEGLQSMVDIPHAYQYITWGTVGECIQYLVRRAQENQDAVTRTKDGRKELGKELLRRLGWPV